MAVTGAIKDGAQTASGGGVRLEFSDSALAELARVVAAGVAAIPKRGLEVGGILAGRPASADGVIRVERVRAVEIEHLYGPSYRLSSQDQTVFEAERKRAHDRDLAPLAHFRSHTRPELEITEDDRMLADLGGSDWMLLVHAGPEGSVASVFRREGAGGWTAGFTFPLGKKAAATAPVERERKVELPEERAPVPATLTPPAARNPLPSLTAPVAAAPAPRRISPRLLAVIGGAAAICLVCLAVIALNPGRRGSVPPTERTPLDLRVSLRSSGLRLDWDGTQALLRNNRGAVLEIKDGGEVRRLELTPEEVRAGSILYASGNQEVSFRLQVESQTGPPLVEIVRFVGPSVAGRTGMQQPPTPPINFDARLPAEVTAVEEAKAEVAGRGSASRRLILPAERPEQAQARNGLLPPLDPRDMPPMAMPSAPGPLTRDLAPTRAPAPARTPAPALSAGPAPTLPSAIQYVAAIAVRRTPPSVPRSTRLLLRDNVTVEVRVRIDQTGNVTEAVPVNAEAPIAKMLAPHAAQAALLWKFNPAKVNGQPAPSEMTLRFNFSRG
jgi:hypothetical protein